MFSDQDKAGRPSTDMSYIGAIIEDWFVECGF